MTIRIKLNPSQKIFSAERNETLLEAALRSGISLKYSCSSGACGECGGRIVSGQVRTIRHHDFNFSATQQAQGYVLLCSCAAESDLEIAVQEVGGVEDIPLQQIPAKVERLEQVQDDMLILHLRTPRSQTLHFLAGQYVTLAIEGLQARSKSLGSCPCNAMNLQFHVRRVHGDPFSEHVFTRLKPSQTVMIEGPRGHFSLDEASKRPIIFVAYETGFAQIKSLIEHTFALEAEQPVHLYWMVRRPGGHYLQNLCRSWVDAMDSFKYTALVGQPAAGGGSWEDASDPGLEARDMERLGEAIFADYPDLSGFDVYLTAPGFGMERIVQALHQHGLPQAQLHLDVIELI